ncbi:MAG: hypothetical protein FWF50_02315 [Defluviitaleaceae bacterium]|nr:hypothetical protein [Defluviitaleaceae bacterium]
MIKIAYLEFVTFTSFVREITNSEYLTPEQKLEMINRAFEKAEQKLKKGE